jgi:predicted DNA repair protein MutK
MVVSLIAILATIGVYGLVALLVRMDDAGYFLIERAQKMQGGTQRIVTSAGSLLVASLPRIIRALGVIGTLAMLLVGGGMFTHNIDILHDALGFMPVLIANLLVGLLVGSLLLGMHQLANRARAFKPLV